MKIKYKDGKEIIGTLDNQTWRTIDNNIEEITIDVKESEDLIMETIMPMLDSDVTVTMEGYRAFGTTDYFVGGTNINIKRKMQVQKIRDRTKQLGDSELAKKLAQAEADLAYIGSVNTDIAEKYQAVMDVFPTSGELNYLIKELEQDCGELNSPIEWATNKKERAFKLNAFKNMVEMLEKQDHTKKPIKYEELEQEK